jgi:hypothetical protein
MPIAALANPFPSVAAFVSRRPASRLDDARARSGFARESPSRARLRVARRRVGRRTAWNAARFGPFSYTVLFTHT